MDDLKDSYSSSDYKRLEEKVCEACTCIVLGRTLKNPNLTRTDAISIFTEWSRDPKKSKIYRKLCETILALYRERKD